MSLSLLAPGSGGGGGDLPQSRPNTGAGAVLGCLGLRGGLSAGVELAVMPLGCEGVRCSGSICWDVKGHGIGWPFCCCEGTGGGGGSIGGRLGNLGVPAGSWTAANVAGGAGGRATGGVAVPSATATPRFGQGPVDGHSWPCEMDRMGSIGDAGTCRVGVTGLLPLGLAVGARILTPPLSSSLG